MKRITIITINYNNRDGLEKTIKSVVAQDYPNLEYIVIDGGSTDGSKEVIERYADKIDFWVSEPDKGIYNAMNKGVSHASGEYVNFMNSGDCFYCNKSVSSIASYSEDYLYGTAVSEKGEILGKLQGNLSFNYMFRSALCHQSSFLKTNIIREYGFDEKYKIAADWKLSLQALVLANCSFKQIDTKIAIYDTTGISSVNTEKVDNERRTILYEIFPKLLIDDYYKNNSSCLTQTLCQDLKSHYRIDKIVFKIATFLLNRTNK